ncbi:MAG: hypothetical protein JO123_09440 [Ktedonobacteraceae bacterium]|nr:hypothetical protein [Ktedonobacteraceae bacterium]
MSEQSTIQEREEQQRTRAFNPNDHVMQLKNQEHIRDYLPVQWRLVWFRDQCPHGTIETEMLQLDPDRETQEETYVWNNERRRNEKVVKQAKGFVIFKATVQDGKGGSATGTKSEKAASFPDYIEKAETGAIGRALAALGYGTQFAPELSEEHRIVDSPVDRRTPAAQGNSSGSAALASVRLGAAASNGDGNTANGAQTVGGTEQTTEAGVTEQQLASIRKLHEHLGKPEPEQVTSLSYTSAKKLIQQLTAEYREQKQMKAS